MTLPMKLIRGAGLGGFLSLSLLAGCGGESTGMNNAADTCATGTEKAMVMTTMRFARQDKPGVSVGFDLDGYTATQGDPKTCGHASLTSPAPESKPGIDNQLSAVLPAIDALAPGTVDSDLQNAISAGMLLIGIDVTHLDDTRNDGCVEVAFSHLSGMATAGTDHILDANQTFDVDKSWPVASTRGTVKDGVLEFGPVDLTVPVKIQDWDFPIAVHDGRVRLSITNDDAIQGVLGGSIEVEDLITKVTATPIDDTVKKTLPDLVRNMADLGLDATSMKCGRISVAATISAKIAFINH